jgi:hypothetical protein
VLDKHPHQPVHVSWTQICADRAVRVARTAAAAAGAATRAAARWEQEGATAEVLVQQACEQAVGMWRGSIETDDGVEDWDLHEREWFATEGMPSHGAIQMQLKRLQAKNQPGTAKSAAATMEREVQKAARAGVHAATQAPQGTGRWQHLVEDGEASAAWRARLQAGEVAPPPFATHGRVGALADFSFSAVREALGGGFLGAPRLAGGGHQLAVPPPGSRPRVSADDFVESMRPDAEQGKPTPPFLQALLEGDLDQAEDFWR